MNPAETLKTIGERLGSSATVSAVFGQPIHAQGKTIVPIARIAYGFGAGGGHGPTARNNANERPEGGGGGGGVRAVPAGALEITESGTRFIPFRDIRWTVGLLAAGILLGKLLPRRR